MFKHLIIIVIAGSAWLACSSNKQASVKPDSPQDVVARVQGQDTSLCAAQRSVSTISFVSQGKKEKMQMVALYNHPGLFKIDMLSTLGSLIVQLVIQDRAVTAYFPMENKLLEGSVESSILQRAWGMDLTLEDIRHFYNRVRIDQREAAVPPAGLELIKSNYALTYQHKDGNVRYWIGGNNAVEKKEWLAADGKAQKTMHFKKYKVWNNMQPFPSAVVLELENGTTVEMSFQERDFKEERIPIETFRLPLPDGIVPTKVE